ncbi:MAG TPA: FTR1 family protein [Gaiellaceae bacterium]|nr:FTR1 family protein [Gaiellaceae bacterium]
MTAGVVTLREGFEASLIVAIVLAFLARSGRRDGFRAVWAGALAAIALSVAAASALIVVGRELEGAAGAAFEGAAMLAAAGLLTWMVFWMRRQARSLRRDLEAQVERALAEGSSFALALTAFVAVLREGMETALFLNGALKGAGALVSGASGAAGLAAAIALGYLFYRGSARLDLRRFFTVTSALLLLLAAYLLAGGLHELAECGAIPESEPLLVGAFAALAGPALYAFFRPRRAVA